MTKNKIVKLITTIAIIALDIVVVVLFMLDLRNEQNIKSTTLARGLVLIISSIMLLFKMYANDIRNIKHKPRVYREQYARYINGAFTTDKKQEKQFMRGLDLFNNGRYYEAIDLLKSLLNQVHNSKDVFATSFFIGVFYRRVDNNEEAIKYYEKALGIFENSGVASNLGVCYQALGNFEGALNAYRMAIRLDPDNANAYSNLAQLCLNESEYMIALEYAEKAMVLDCNHSVARKTAAICHALLGDVDEYKRLIKSPIISASDRRNAEDFLRMLGAGDEVLE